MLTAMSKSHMERQNQQDKLNSKLNERLGNGEIYFKRDAQVFFNNLTFLQRQELLDRLKSLYSQILMKYFSEEEDLNNLIDRFVEEAFFVNLPMNKVVEIHLELIDKLDRQLKFEGLNTEHLSDFRLTLIDVIAHLGEMYRSVVCNHNLES